MKRIINGKAYNTETAREIAELTCNAYNGDFEWHRTKLYVTKNGAFFLAGHGGASSMWSSPAPGGCYGDGEGIKIIDEEDARSYLEAENETDTLEQLFNIEEA